MSKFLTFLFCFVALSSLAQEIVHVSAKKEQGNGVLIGRPGDSNCYIITPEHVATASILPLKISDRHKVIESAQLEQTFPNDLAILRVQGNGFKCQPLKLSNQYNLAIKNSSTGYIEYLDGMGMYKLIHVNITQRNNDIFTVIAQNPEENFKKGMSGSSFYIDYQGEKILAGMAKQVVDNSKQVLIQQFDDLLNLLSSFFYEETKRLGIMLQKDNTIDVKLNNQLVTAVNAKKLYESTSKFNNDSFIMSNWNAILSGNFKSTIPTGISDNLDVILLGKISEENRVNENNQHVIYIKLEGGLYSSLDFKLIKSVSVYGKGVSYNKDMSIRNANEKLIDNIQVELSN